MLPEKILAWGKTRSCIRELAEYGARRKAEIGAENVYDFSLGNPSVPVPECVDEAVAEILKDSSDKPHAYTTAAGLLSLRKRIAEDVNGRFGLDIDPERIYVTCGAAAGLTISLKAVLEPGEEVVVIAPFFPEYRVFTEASGGVLKVVPAAADFKVDIEAFKAAVSEKTRAVIINSPNNPSGAVLSDDDLGAMADILREAEERYDRTIYLISDEPYREIVYDGRNITSPLSIYADSIMCYSFSKSLSIPGERIGYIAVNSRMKDAGEVYAAIMGAGRALGYVNPPSLFQRVIERCIGVTADISEYELNRKTLTEGLKSIGYEYVEPEGAFYLFLKALEPDAKAFSERAKKHELLLVPSDDFGCTGYVRVSYCVAGKTIEDSMPAFKALFDEYSK